MKIGQIKKIILFGGSNFLAEFARYLKKTKKFDVLVFSSKRHLEEVLWKENISLGEFLKKIDVQYFASKDINSEINLKKNVNKNTIGIAFGAAWIFKKKTVGLFEKYHLLDFMGIDLPRYRGGAHSTWQILHRNRVGVINLQIIEGDIDSFHKGKIIKRVAYKIPRGLKTPIEFYDNNIVVCRRFFRDFLSDLEKGSDFETKMLDETRSAYYPFLSTEINGLINWDWNGENISLFIDAFDEPYRGASTFLYEQKVYLKKCQMLPKEDNYHPYSSGLVIRKGTKSIFIATVGKLLKLDQVLNKNGINIIDNVQVGDKFYTPYKELDKSRSFKAVYNWKGLTSERDEK